MYRRYGRCSKDDRLTQSHEKRRAYTPIVGQVEFRLLDWLQESGPPLQSDELSEGRIPAATLEAPLKLEAAQSDVEQVRAKLDRHLTMGEELSQLGDHTKAEYEARRDSLYPPVSYDPEWDGQARLSSES